MAKVISIVLIPPARPFLGNGDLMEFMTQISRLYRVLRMLVVYSGS